MVRYCHSLQFESRLTSVYKRIHTMPQLPLALSDASGVPFYRQIEDQLAELIRAGVLHPGDQLPSVRALAAELLVSLITIRRAYADLEADGLVDRRQGQGTFVAEDVVAASRERARREARQVLADAVQRARQLGMDETEQQAFLETLINREVTS